MCGICGQFNTASGDAVQAEEIRRMTRTIVHRGPDDEGYFLSGAVGLGFRRLSIIDLGGGHQPMTDAQESVWVIFNGEIYNFKELRSGLEKEGYVFRSSSDTEVIVNGYKKWGIDVLNHLNGMFALAIWDVEKKQLLIARDRMGIKPLYYTLENNQLRFASEIRALLAGQKTKPAVDPIGLNLFLRYRYTPSPLTIFNGIKKLAPGTRLIAVQGAVHIERWWHYTPVPFDRMPTPHQAREELLDLYQKALDRHLISDVPLGVLLSGGLDSGLLLAMMSQGGRTWNSYTVGFGSATRDDELASAAASARIFGSPNYPIELTRDEFEKTLNEIVSIVEEPVAAPSIVPMYHVCRRARQDVKVALMGQGPDELFGGYKRHLGVHYGKYWRAVPGALQAPLTQLLGKLPRNEAVKRALYSLNQKDVHERYTQVFSIISGETMDRLFRDDVLPPDAEETIFRCWADLFPMMENLDELGGLQFLEIRSSLPDELLMYADKLSMAHSLEVRVPYLDKEIVEYVERLGSSFKVRNLTGKWLHRQVCENYLPAEIVKRKKVGFVAPVDQWFRDSCTHKMHDRLMDTSACIYDYLVPESVHRLLAEHRAGASDNAKILFSLTVLEEWMRTYVA